LWTCWLLEETCCLLFLITYVSMLRISHLRLSHWLEVLIAFNLSVKIVLMFRHDTEKMGWNVTFHHWTEGGGYGFVARHLLMSSGHWVLFPSWSDQDKLAEVSYKKGEFSVSELLSL
jgi:hypothetical protein